MAINFPDSPVTDETFTSGTTTWKWDGTAWNVVIGIADSGAVDIPTDLADLTDNTNIIPDSILDLGISDGTSGQVLTTNGSGSFSFTTVSGGGGGSGEPNQNAFSTISVPGQDSVIADSTTDTLNIQPGLGINITTNETSDTLIITNSASVVENITDLTDVTTAGVDISQLYESAIATLRVDNNTTTAYTFNSHYSGDNPTIFALSGTTIAFDLSGIAGHPFEIQNSTGTPYDTGLVHVAPDGTVSLGTNAQGKDSGTLYWRIPITTTSPPNYRYQCTSHAAMVGAITIKDFNLI